MGKASRKFFREKQRELLAKQKKNSYTLADLEDYFNRGFDKGDEARIEFFQQRVATLDEVEGIGDVLFKRIVEHLGFSEVKPNE